MVKTAFAGANGVQPLLHTKKTNKIARQKAALRLLLAADDSERQRSHY